MAQRKKPKKPGKPVPGSGTGSNYVPGFTVRSFGSQGNHTRMPGWKTKRHHEFPSDLELRYFFVLEWSTRVIDIREQFPLPLEKTLAIAEELGITHPMVRGEPKVITTDFLITIRGEFDKIYKARSIKPLEQLENPKHGRRNFEKLEVERVYWSRRKPPADWGLVTEKEIPVTLAENVKLVHDAYFPESLEPLPQKEVPRIAQLLTQRVCSEEVALRIVCQQCDKDFNLIELDADASICLTLARHLIATRQWKVNMNEPLDWNQPLKLLSVSLR